MEFNSFLTGFIDGEGCFHISFTKRKKMKTGIEVRPSFSVSQQKRNLSLIKRIHEHFACGAIRFSRSDHNYKYEVRSLADLRKQIIPHFRSFPLQSSKARDFEKFVQICDLMANHQHVTSDGLRKIIDLAYQMNPAGKRRYLKKELLKVLDKMKV